MSRFCWYCVPSSSSLDFTNLPCITSLFLFYFIVVACRCVQAILWETRSRPGWMIADHAKEEKQHYKQMKWHTLYKVIPNTTSKVSSNSTEKRITAVFFLFHLFLYLVLCLRIKCWYEKQIEEETKYKKRTQRRMESRSAMAVALNNARGITK